MHESMRASTFASPALSSTVWVLVLAPLLAQLHGAHGWPVWAEEQACWMGVTTVLNTAGGHEPEPSGM
eukprot:361912-Pleurochrysis_carterae.AAC.5